MILSFIVVGAILAAAFGTMAGLNTAFVPAVQDSLLLMENATTKTASYLGATFDLSMGNGTFEPGACGQAIGAVVNVTDFFTDGSDTFSFALQESADGYVWTTISPAVPVTAAGMLTVPGFVSQPYIRLNLTIAGNTGLITYSAWANPNIVPG